MAATDIPVTLSSRTNDWDDLTELVEALSEYNSGDLGAVYAAVQNVAEGLPAQLSVGANAYDEFVAHMAEFRINVSPSRT